MSANDKRDYFWIDKLSKDEFGWMNAIPYNEQDNKSYSNWIKVVEVTPPPTGEEITWAAEKYTTEEDRSSIKAFEIVAFKAGVRWALERMNLK